VLSALLEIVLSFGLYYLLRALGAGVFWALTVPAVVVGAVAVAATVRRRRLDMIGLLVLAELAATLTLTLITRSPRVAAIREPVYYGIGGLFCLSTLLHRVPMAHRFAASVATFGDPERVRAFTEAWRDDPRYRFWQRLLTTAIGLVLVVGSGIRIIMLSEVSPARIAHAVDVSNVISFATIGAVVLVSAVLIQPSRRIIERRSAP
jgi:hypothetical protein